MQDDVTEAVARAIAEALGDDFDDAFINKALWIEGGGVSGGRFRDVNEPFQVTYLEAARAAIAAMPSRDAWQDIATAPKDEFILLYEDGMMRCGMWENGRWQPAEIPVLVDEWGNRIVSSELQRLRPGESLELAGFLYEPTHWQPLPAPPEARKHLTEQGEG